jgi:hypothetical protein
MSLRAGNVRFVLDRPSASLRERDDSFGRPTNRVAEDWCGADHAVIGNDQAGNEVRPDDAHLLGMVVWAITAWIGIH